MQILSRCWVGKDFLTCMSVSLLCYLFSHLSEGVLGWRGLPCGRFAMLIGCVLKKVEPGNGGAGLETAMVAAHTRPFEGQATWLGAYLWV